MNFVLICEEWIVAQILFIFSTRNNIRPKIKLKYKINAWKYLKKSTFCFNNRKYEKEITVKLGYDENYNRNIYFHIF